MMQSAKRSAFAAILSAATSYNEIAISFLRVFLCASAPLREIKSVTILVPSHFKGEPTQNSQSKQDLEISHQIH